MCVRDSRAMRNIAMEYDGESMDDYNVNNGTLYSVNMEYNAQSLTDGSRDSRAMRNRAM